MSAPTKLPRDLHRDTLQVALRVLGRAEDLSQGTALLMRLLNGYDKARRSGLSPDAALALAEERTGGVPPSKSNRADAAPVRLADRILNRSQPS